MTNACSFVCIDERDIGLSPFELGLLVHQIFTAKRICIVRQSKWAVGAKTDGARQGEVPRPVRGNSR